MCDDMGYHWGWAMGVGIDQHGALLGAGDSEHCRADQMDQLVEVGTAGKLRRARPRTSHQ